MFAEEYNSEMKKMISASIHRKQMVLWQKWFMHRVENPAKKVRSLWAPQ
jgi:hypothetical protein